MWVFGGIMQDLIEKINDLKNQISILLEHL